VTLQAMRQHLGAVVWHAREAIAEAPHAELIPDLVHQVDVTGLDAAIDSGYVQEAAHRESHILPAEPEGPK
jgi:hypothetical protein